VLPGVQKKKRNVIYLAFSSKYWPLKTRAREHEIGSISKSKQIFIFLQDAVLFTCLNLGKYGRKWTKKCIFEELGATQYNTILKLVKKHLILNAITKRNFITK